MTDDPPDEDFLDAMYNIDCNWEDDEDFDDIRDEIFAEYEGDPRDDDQ